MKIATLITAATAAATVGVLAASMNLVQAQTANNADKPSYMTAGSNQTVGATTDNLQGTTGNSRPIPAPATTAAPMTTTSASSDTTGTSNSGDTMAARADRN